MIEKPDGLPIGRVFGYVRVSTAYQRDSGDSPETQTKKIERLYEEVWKERGYSWGGIYFDQVSARSKEFAKREMGGRLHREMRRGDVIILARLDRCFRSSKDAFTTMDYWVNLGVTPVVVNINLDLSTAMGQAMFGFMATMCQFESAMLSERVRDRILQLKSEGYYPHAAPPLLYVRKPIWIGEPGSKKQRWVLEYDETQRQWARYSKELSHRCGSRGRAWSFLYHNRIHVPWLGRTPDLSYLCRMELAEAKIQAIERSQGKEPGSSLPPLVRWPIWRDKYTMVAGPLTPTGTNQQAETG